MIQLTDQEIMDATRDMCREFRWPSTALDIAQAILAAQEAKRGEAVSYENADVAYGMIDGYLRETLPYDKYVEYSNALDLVWRHSPTQQAPAQSGPCKQCDGCIILEVDPFLKVSGDSASLEELRKRLNGPAQAVPSGKPVKFLANGTRFKMSFFEGGDSSDDTFVKCFNDFRGELDGQWVALVPAEDDCHRKLTNPTPPATKQATPATEARDGVVELNIIRYWPDGFADDLEKLWIGLVGFIPNYKLYDLQRLLDKCGFTMTVVERARAQKGGEK